MCLQLLCSGKRMRPADKLLEAKRAAEVANRRLAELSVQLAAARREEAAARDRLSWVIEEGERFALEMGWPPVSAQAAIPAQAQALVPAPPLGAQAPTLAGTASPKASSVTNQMALGEGPGREPVSAQSAAPNLAGGPAPASAASAALGVGHGDQRGSAASAARGGAAAASGSPSSERAARCATLDDGAEPAGSVQG